MSADHPPAHECEPAEAHLRLVPAVSLPHRPEPEPLTAASRDAIVTLRVDERFSSPAIFNESNPPPNAKICYQNHPPTPSSPPLPPPITTWDRTLLQCRRFPGGVASSGSGLLHGGAGPLEELQHDGVDGSKLLPLASSHRLHVGLQSAPSGHTAALQADVIMNHEHSASWLEM